MQNISLKAKTYLAKYDKGISVYNENIILDISETIDILNSELSTFDAEIITYRLKLLLMLSFFRVYNNLFAIPSICQKLYDL